jgi:DNA-binding CsgD family transcriptional regulator
MCAQRRGFPRLSSARESVVLTARLHLAAFVRGGEKHMAPSEPGVVSASENDFTAMQYAVRVGDRRVPVSARGLVLGRAASCDIRLDHPLVSRRHAGLRALPGALEVRDLGSRNGVFLHGRRIAGTTLIDAGQVLTIGIDAVEVLLEVPSARRECISTLPPPPPSRVPDGLADVDGPEMATAAADLDSLTPRERDVLSLLVMGHTQKEVAERLHLSTKTVETHRARLSDKLGCRTRAELVCVGISAGLLRVR